MRAGGRGNKRFPETRVSFPVLPGEPFIIYRQCKPGKRIGDLPGERKGERRVGPTRFLPPPQKSPKKRQARLVGDAHSPLGFILLRFPKMQ